MKAVVAGKGVRIEAKAAVGGVELDSVGTARGNSGAVGMAGGQEFGERTGGNAPRRRATTRCRGGQGMVGRVCQVTRL